MMKIWFILQAFSMMEDWEKIPFFKFILIMMICDLRLKQQIRQRTYVVINISIYEKVHGLMSPL